MSMLDFNFNFNATAPATAGAALRCRPRYNSDVESRLVDTSQMLVPPAATTPPNYPPFHPYWDADLQACMFLDDFLEAVIATATTAGTTWRATYATAARASGANVPSKEMTQTKLNSEVLEMLDLALEREDRFAEIIDQDDADGVINYWLGMLKIDPARHPRTNLMVHVGRRVGEHVVMCLKGDFASPRPSQLCPAITPMFDPPATPTFPAGHAVQSYLISYLLAYSLPKVPQQTTPANFAQATGPLFDLALRVSQNRIIAGVHFPTDIDAGKAVAIQIFTDLQGVGSVWGTASSGAPPSLMQGVQAEFPQYGP